METPLRMFCSTDDNICTDQTGSVLSPITNLLAPIHGNCLQLGKHSTFSRQRHEYSGIA